MKVIVPNINNPENVTLHWDFIRETCESFGVLLHNKKDVTLPPPRNNIVALRASKGGSLATTNLVGIDTILVGRDDTDNEWLEGYRAIKIETPVDCGLWSGVALGIVLYMMHLSSPLKK